MLFLSYVVCFFLSPPLDQARAIMSLEGQPQDLLLIVAPFLLLDFCRPPHVPNALPGGMFPAEVLFFFFLFSFKNMSGPETSVPFNHHFLKPGVQTLPSPRCVVLFEPPWCPSMCDFVRSMYSNPCVPLNIIYTPAFLVSRTGRLYWGGGGFFFSPHFCRQNLFPPPPYGHAGAQAFRQKSSSHFPARVCSRFPLSPQTRFLPTDTSFGWIIGLFFLSCIETIQPPFLFRFSAQDFALFIWSPTRGFFPPLVRFVASFSLSPSFLSRKLWSVENARQEKTPPFLPFSSLGDEHAFFCEPIRRAASFCSSLYLATSGSCFFPKLAAIFFFSLLVFARGRVDDQLRQAPFSPRSIVDVTPPLSPFA